MTAGFKSISTQLKASGRQLWSFRKSKKGSPKTAPSAKTSKKSLEFMLKAQLQRRLCGAADPVRHDLRRNAAQTICRPT
jgi:hypothetical protein